MPTNRHCVNIVNQQLAVGRKLGSVIILRNVLKQSKNKTYAISERTGLLSHKLQSVRKYIVNKDYSSSIDSSLGLTKQIND